MGLSIIVLPLALKVISELAAQEVKSDKDQTDIMIPLQVETAGTQFLCYHANTMDFVCQGSSLKEICEQFAQRFPDKNVAFVDGDDDAIAVLKQQFKQSLT